VPNSSLAHLGFYVEVLLKLDELNIPYVIIGGFAATMFGITRTTYDIDIVVDMQEDHIAALSSSFPSPPYYADPYQMRNAIEKGMSFNIIDGSRAEKVDLFPITMDERYRPTLKNRLRRKVEPVGAPPFEVWVARPEDVIVGKLMAWEEGQSTRHSDDIYEMMLFHYLDHTVEDIFDFDCVAQSAAEISNNAAALWQFLNDSARKTADQSDG
jgi:hypothetical protein